MPRLVVLPYAIEPHDAIERADLLLGRPLGSDLASRLRVAHVELDSAVDAEYVDPLVATERGGCYLYTRELASELAPTLIARLELDGVIFAELRLPASTQPGQESGDAVDDAAPVEPGGDEASRLQLRVWLLDGDGVVFEWQGQAAAPGAFQPLNVDATRALHDALEIEPSARETERVERITTRSLTALRMMALADAIGDEQGRLVQVQRARLLESALRADPGYVDAMVMLADTRASMGDAMGAHEMLTRWLERHPDQHDVRLHAARMALRGGSPDAAVDAAREVVAADPYALDALRLLTSSLIAAQRPEEAAFAAREALWRFPGDIELRRSAALASLATDRTADAIEALSALVAELPAHPDLYLELGHALELDDQLDEALAAYRSALDLGSRPLASKAIELGRFLLVQGFPAEAAAVLGRAEVATSANRGRVGAYLSVAMLTLDFAAGLGVALARMGTGWLSEMAEPDSAMTFVQIELSLLRDEDLEGLDALIETWRSRDGGGDATDTLLLAWWAMAVALHRGDVDRAAAVYAGVEIAGGRAALLRRLDWLIARSVDHDRRALAERALSLYLELANDDGVGGALLRVAHARVRMGRTEDVLVWLAPMLDEEPPLLGVVEMVARLMVDDGRLSRAIEVVDAASARAGMGSTAGLAGVRAWLAARADDPEAFGRALGEALFAVPGEREQVVALIGEALRRAPEDGLGDVLVDTVGAFLDDAERDEGQAGFAAQLLVLAGAVEMASASLPPGTLDEPESLVAAGLLAERRGSVEQAHEDFERAVAREHARGDVGWTSSVALAMVLMGEAQPSGGPELESSPLASASSVGVRAARLLEQTWLRHPHLHRLRAALRRAVALALTSEHG